MPPPERPCGRTAGGGEAQQLRIGRDEDQLVVGAAELEAADDLVAVVEPDDVPRVLAEHLGLDPLDDAALGAEREAERVVGQRRQRDGALARTRATRNSLTGAPPCSCGALAVDGSTGRSRTSSLSSRPAEVMTPTVPRAVAVALATIDVVLGPGAAASGRPRRCRCGRAGRPTTGRRSRGRRSPRAARRTRPVRRPTRAGRYDEACRAAWRSRTARRRRPCAAASRRRGSRSAPRSWSSSVAFSSSSSSLENLVSRRSGMSRM